MLPPASPLSSHLSGVEAAAAAFLLEVEAAVVCPLEVEVCPLEVEAFYHRDARHGGHPDCAPTVACRGHMRGVCRVCEGQLRGRQAGVRAYRMPPISRLSSRLSSHLGGPPYDPPTTTHHAKRPLSQHHNPLNTIGRMHAPLGLWKSRRGGPRSWYCL